MTVRIVFHEIEPPTERGEMSTEHPPGPHGERFVSITGDWIRWTDPREPVTERYPYDCRFHRIGNTDCAEWLAAIIEAHKRER